MYKMSEQELEYVQLMTHECALRCPMVQQFYVTIKLRKLK